MHTEVETYSIGPTKLVPLDRFLHGKTDELINIYKEAFPDVKQRVANDLKEMDPANANRYSEIIKG